MATDTRLAAFNSATVTNYRAWAQAIHDGLQAVGMVQTADTGQINLTTVALPGAGNFGGYEIWRFADALQATAPVFMKIEYGNGANTNTAIMRVTVSNATNGAGTLNGSMVTGSPVITGQSTTETNQTPFLFCGDTSSVVFALSAQIAANGFQPSMVMIERTRNADGTPNGDGLAFSTVQGYGSVNGAVFGDSTTQVLSFLTTAISGVGRWLPIANPAVFAYWDAAGSVGTDINLFPYLVATPKPEAQMLSVIGCYSLAQAVMTTCQVVANGATHTYIALGGLMYATTYPSSQPATWTPLGYGQNSRTASLLMRWE